MFNFFKKNTLKKETKEIKETSNDVPKLYLKKVKNYIWSDYIKLNKYEKVYAFSAENINDIKIINALRNSYFNPEEPNNRIPLSKEIKAEIKKLGVLLRDIHYIITLNIVIFNQLSHYIKKDQLIFSKYIRISSLITSSSLPIELKLDNTVFHKDDKELYKYIPPNHPKDSSRFIFLSEKELTRYDSLSINTKECEYLLHEDYDFNIFQFIIDDFK